MNILETQQIGIRTGNESAEFFAHFPERVVRCRWIDARQGLFETPGYRGGFYTAHSSMCKDIQCEPIAAPDTVVHVNFTKVQAHPSRKAG